MPVLPGQLADGSHQPHEIHGHGGHEDQSVLRLRWNLPPPYRPSSNSAAVHHVGKKGDQYDGRHRHGLGRHQAQEGHPLGDENSVLPNAFGNRRGKVRQEILGSYPDHRAYENHRKGWPHVAQVGLCSGDAPDTHPHIVVGPQEQEAHQEALHDKEAGKLVRHHEGGDGGVVQKELLGQDVARQGKGHQGGHADEVADVAHPVIESSVLILSGGEEHERREERHDEAAEGDVGNEPVQVQAAPGIVVHPGPEAGGLRRLRGCQHVGAHGVYQQHHHRTHDIQRHADRYVDPFALPKLVPGIPVNVHQERLDEEEDNVQAEDRAEPLK